MINPILYDQSYSVDERLEMAKELLKLEVLEVDRLSAQADDIRSQLAWIDDQTSNKRMGL